MVEQHVWNQTKGRDCETNAEKNGVETMKKNWLPNQEVIDKRIPNVSTGLDCKSNIEVALHSHNEEVRCELHPHLHSF